MLPGLDEARDAQVRDRESGDACLAASAAPGRRLVADLATGTGRGTREGRDRGGVVVRLDLHQDLDPSRLGRVPLRARIRDEPACLVSAHDRRVVAVRGQHLARVLRLRVADHLEQRPLTLDAVDGPRRVENLVAAMLGVHLREHHQLDVGRVPAEFAEPGAEVVELSGTQRQAEGCVRVLESPARVCAECDRRM